MQARALAIATMLFVAGGCADRATTTPRVDATSVSVGRVSAPVDVASAAAPPPPTAQASAASLGTPRAIDMHVDTPWQVKFKGKSIHLVDNQATIQNLKDGQYGGVVYPIYISDKLHGGKPTIQDADQIFTTIDHIVAKHSNLLWADTKGPTPAGMITVYVAIEGAGAFARDIKEIDRFIARGVIFVGPVHWNDSGLATSATGRAGKRRGLTKLGKEFCERVYRAGGIIDVSHMSDRAFADLVPIAKAFDAPIVATHSNARALADHPRNLTDEQLRILKSTGGVAGLNFYRDYVKVGPQKDATVDDLVKHALHMIRVAGVEHVGIGTDFDGGESVKGLEDAGKMLALAKALEAAGVSEADVHKIFSGNTLRVIEWARDRRRRAAR
jgi:membrane dipeptidase